MSPVHQLAIGDASDFAVYGYFASEIGRQFFPGLLIDRLGADLAPAYYIMLLGIVGLAIMWPMAETNGRALDA